MESKKLQGSRWWGRFLRPKNSNSQWLQVNLEEMHGNFRRMLKIIEDSNADSFTKKVELYYQSRQELVNLVEKCYRIHLSLAQRHNHATGEPLINMPNLDHIRSQGRGIIMSNASSGKSSVTQSQRRLCRYPSSKQFNVNKCSVSKKLKRRASVKGGNSQKGRDEQRGGGPRLGGGEAGEEELECYLELCDLFVGAEFDDEYDDDEDKLQHVGTNELEAELCDMIEKLYIQMEGDQDVSKLQGKILRHEDNACDYDAEFRKVKESVSSNVDKALLEEKLELNIHSKGELQNLQSQQRVKTSTRPAPMPAVPKIIRFSLPDDSFSSSDDEEEELQHEGTDELEAELRDMIEKLYIQMEGDQDVSKLQDRIPRYEDNTRDDDDEFREVRESISSNVDKALLEENLELRGNISQLLKDILRLVKHNEKTNECCESLEETLSQARAERTEAETLLASEAEQLKASIVKKNNDVEELNKMYEAVVAERDQLKARVAMLEA